MDISSSSHKRDVNIYRSNSRSPVSSTHSIRSNHSHHSLCSTNSFRPTNPFWSDHLGKSMSSSGVIPQDTHSKQDCSLPINQISDPDSTETSTLTSTLALASTSVSTSGLTVPLKRSSVDMVRVKTDTVKSSSGSPAFMKPSHQAPVPPSSVPDTSGVSDTSLEDAKPEDRNEDRVEPSQLTDQVEMITETDSSVSNRIRNERSNVMNEGKRKSLSKKGLTASTPDLSVLARNSRGSVPSIENRQSFLQPSDQSNFSAKPTTISSPSVTTAAATSSSSLLSLPPKPTRSMSESRPAVSHQSDHAQTPTFKSRTATSHNGSSQYMLSSSPQIMNLSKASIRQSSAGQVKASGGVEHLKTPLGVKSRTEGLDKESSPGRSFRSKAKNAFSKFFNSSPSGLSNGGVGILGLEPAAAKKQPIRTLPGPEDRIKPEGDLLFGGHRSVKSFESDLTDQFASRRPSDASVITTEETLNMAVPANANSSRSSLEPPISMDQPEKERSFVLVSGKKKVRTLSDPLSSPLDPINQTDVQSSAVVVNQSNMDLPSTDTHLKTEKEMPSLPPPTTTSSSESRSNTPTGDETIVQDSDLTLSPNDPSPNPVSRSISPADSTVKHRKANLSVGAMSGIGIWECDLEGLLDGIAQKGNQQSFSEQRHGVHKKRSLDDNLSKDVSGQVEHSIERGPVNLESMTSTTEPVLGLPIEPSVISTFHGNSSPKPANHMMRSVSEPYGEPKPGVDSDSKSVNVVAVSSQIIDAPRESLSSPSSSTSPVTPPPASLDVSLSTQICGRSISPISTTTAGGSISSASSVIDQRIRSANALDIQHTIRLVPSSPSPVLSKLPHDGLPSSGVINTKWKGLHGLGLGVDDANGDREEDKMERLKNTDEIDIKEILKGVLEDDHAYEEVQNEAGDAVDKILRKDQGFKWVQTNRIAEFLGGRGPVNVAAASLYMESFEFTGMKLDQAIRKLTSELYFKAETQELDRIIIAFCERYLECNPDTLFGSVDVLHQVAYSLLLLNTDLHVADQDRKMTRNQFVENTMGSIRTEISTLSQSKISTQLPFPSPPITDESMANNHAQDMFDDVSGPSDRLSIRSKISNRTHNSLTHTLPSTSDARSNSPFDLVHPTSSQSVVSTTMSFGSSVSSPLVGTPVGSVSYDPRVSRMSRPGLEVSSSSASVLGSMFSKSWSHEMETTLKDLYNSVKSQEIIQPVNAMSETGRLSNNLSPVSPEKMTRNQSTRSQSSSASRLNSLKRGSIRGFTTLTGGLGGLGSPYSVNSSSGRLSPTLSVATSMGEEYSESIHQSNPSMGFASNLNNTIIKEHDAESVHSAVSVSTIGEILDEELALLGSPWAKEGLVTRKYYTDLGGKRSKDKAWRNLFAVVQKGSFKTFTFESPGNSSNLTTVGGGNWLSNATAVDEFSLSHSISKILPAPGYNRHRPFVFVISLPSGIQTYFQVGTDMLTEEWVSTCNYWAARVSKEPLTGGVSNMDYGWGQPSFGGNSETESVVSSKRQSSFLSSGHGTHVNEWKPPSQPLYPSKHDEESQLEALRKYLVKLDEEIAEHTMAESFLIPLRHLHGSRAHDNYRRKKQFLKEEHQKYTIYISSLEAGLVARLSKKGELRLNHALEKASR